MPNLEDRVHYELPLNHPDFNEIRTAHCICENNEAVEDYRHSNDNLMIMVKFYSTDTLPSVMIGLNELNESNENWIKDITSDPAYIE